MSSFYMLLPSNASMKVHPRNVLTEYTVELPYPVHLEGKYEVALRSFEYTQSWNNVREKDKILKFGINGHVHDVEIIEGFYDHETDIINIINDSIKASILSEASRSDDIKTYLGAVGAGKLIYLSYEPISRHVSVFSSANCWLKMSDNLASILGFTDSNTVGSDAVTEDRGSYLRLLKREKYTQRRSPSQVDYHRGLHLLYVYCNIVSGQIVGDVFAPLLKTVGVTGAKFGETIMKEYVNPEYIPVLTNQFSRVTVSIRDDTGEVIPFNRGRVTAQLHFRRQSEL